MSQAHNETTPENSEFDGVIGHIHKKDANNFFCCIPEPEIVTLKDNSNEQTLPYGSGRQLPLIPPNLNDLNLPLNPFNILATMAVVNSAENGYHDNCSPQSPELAEPSPITTPPMNVSTIDGWDTPDTLTDDKNCFTPMMNPGNLFFAINSYPTAATPTAEKKTEP